MENLPVDFDQLEYWCCFYFSTTKEAFVYAFIGTKAEEAKKFKEKYPSVGGQEMHMYQATLGDIKKTVADESLSVIVNKFRLLCDAAREALKVLP